jgi:hypothetical protein
MQSKERKENRQNNKKLFQRGKIGFKTSEKQEGCKGKIKLSNKESKDKQK